MKTEHGEFLHYIEWPVVYPGNRMVIPSGSAILSGWAIWDEKILSVHAFVNGRFHSEAKIDIERRDVEKALSRNDARHCGFEVPLDIGDDAKIELQVKTARKTRNLQIFASRNAPADICFLSMDSFSSLFRTVVGRDPTFAEVANLLRVGAGQSFSRADYINSLVRLEEFTRQLSRASDIFSEFLDIQFRGATFRLPADDHITKSLMAGHDYEPYVLTPLLESLSPDMCFVDVGANVGLFSVLAGKKLPNGKVYAIEAATQNAKLIAINAEINHLNNIHVIPIGAAESVGMNFWKRQSFTTNNRIVDVPSLFKLHFDSFDLIGVAPLDRLLNPEERVDVIKLDIEGREFRALSGARNILNRWHPMVYCEYSPIMQRAASGVDGRALLDFMLSFGYEIKILHRRREAEVLLGSGNSIAEQLDCEFTRHCAEDAGTHLDVCFFYSMQDYRGSDKMC